jgi:hypothetical protein
LIVMTPNRDTAADGNTPTSATVRVVDDSRTLFF